MEEVAWQQNDKRKDKSVCVCICQSLPPPLSFFFFFLIYTVNYLCWSFLQKKFLSPEEAKIIFFVEINFNGTLTMFEFSSIYYIYITVIHRQMVSLYHNSSVLLDMMLQARIENPQTLPKTYYHTAQPSGNIHQVGNY